MVDKEHTHVDKIEGQICPVCYTKTLTLTEAKQEIPYFGTVFIFSMECSSCGYRKADLEAEEQKDPAKYTFEVSSEKDINVRIVKSSGATVKIPHVTTITPGPASEGYVTNIEGLLNRVIEQIENLRENAEEKEDRKKAKNLLKKLQRVMWGQENLKIILEDPSGNSAIIDDRAVVTKLKG